MDRRLLYAGGLALAGGGVAVALLVRRYMQDVRGKQLAETLAPRLPARLARWAYPVCYAAIRTRPSDFSGDEGAWALLGFAVMDRESLGGDGAGYAPRGAWEGFGDNGHAVTPWQLDVRYHKSFYSSGRWRDPVGASEYAFSAVLAPNWRRFRDRGPLALAGTVAAYNASPARVEAALDAGVNPDSVTTGGNYSADVLARLDGFTFAGGGGGQSGGAGIERED